MQKTRGSQKSPKRVQEDDRDRDLVRSYLTGDKGALEKLYRLYERRVFLLCRKFCGNPDDAADLAHETFISVVGKLDKVDINGFSFSGYLQVSARNACIKHLRKMSKSSPVEELHEQFEQRDQHDIETDPERSLLLRDQRSAVRNANAKLADRQQRALALRELQGQSYEKIAAELRLSTNAAAQLICRARVRLMHEVRGKATTVPVAKPACQRAHALLSKDFIGEVKSCESNWLDHHISNCDSCRANLESMQEAGESFRALLPAVLATQFRHLLKSVISYISPMGSPAVAVSLGPILVATTIMAGALVSPSKGSPADSAVQSRLNKKVHAAPSAGTKALKLTNSPAQLERVARPADTTKKPLPSKPKDDRSVSQELQMVAHTAYRNQGSRLQNRRTVNTASLRRPSRRETDRNSDRPDDRTIDRPRPRLRDDKSISLLSSSRPSEGMSQLAEPVRDISRSENNVQAEQPASDSRDQESGAATDRSSAEGSRS